MFDKNKLFLIIAIVVAIIVVYFVVSPYQNCMRGGVVISQLCTYQTAW